LRRDIKISKETENKFELLSTSKNIPQKLSRDTLTNPLPPHMTFVDNVPYYLNGPLVVHAYPKGFIYVNKESNTIDIFVFVQLLVTEVSWTGAVFFDFAVKYLNLFLIKQSLSGSFL